MAGWPGLIRRWWNARHSVQMTGRVSDLPSSLDALNPMLDSFQHLYNHHRPHGALDGPTPAHHLAKLQAAKTPPSHMC